MLRGDVAGVAKKPGGFPTSVIGWGYGALRRLYALMYDVVFGEGVREFDARDVQSYFRTTEG